ncbi:MAG: membrane protein insertase YidC, partial [Candidatus Blochmannia sp. A2]|nr:membrane protein insertase YidC [Candidatus Blochmannia sp. A2]
YSNIDTKYEKYKFNDISQKNNLYISTKNIWIAMLQQYFVSAWIPENTGINTIYTSNENDGVAVIGYQSPIFNIPS